jgi:hypothetical protein
MLLAVLSSGHSKIMAASKVHQINKIQLERVIQIEMHI